MPLSTAHAWDHEYEDTRVSPVYEPLWHMLQSFLGSVPASTVLEFGCGDGTYACQMSKMGIRITGIDISGNAIKKATARKCSNCTFFTHDSIPDHLSNESFDAVVVLNSLHCLTRDCRSQLLSQVKRVLKQNGHFFASVLAMKDESYPRQEWKETEPNTFLDEFGKTFHFFSETELIEELADFQITEIRLLQNIHPACGKRSALFVVTAISTGS